MKSGHYECSAFLKIEKYTQKCLLSQTIKWCRPLFAGFDARHFRVRILVDKVEMCFFSPHQILRYFPVSITPSKARYFYRLQNNRTGSTVQKPSIHYLPEALCTEVKQQGFEADQLPSRNVEVKNKRSCNSNILYVFTACTAGNYDFFTIYFPA